VAAILRLDSAGNPLHWIHHEEAACYYAKGMVAWTIGEPFRILHGGRNRLTGLLSYMDIHPVIAIHGVQHGTRSQWRAPSLTNPSLFRRDGHLCLYCGKTFSDHHHLTRDHIVQRRQGHLDQCRIRLQAVQQSQGGQNSRAGRDEVAGSALHAQSVRISVSDRSKHSGRSNGFFTVWIQQAAGLKSGYHKPSIREERRLFFVHMENVLFDAEVNSGSDKRF